MSPSPLTAMNTETTRLWNAAQVAIRTLTGLGYIHTCFIGGVACALHGNTRTPKVCAAGTFEVMG